MVEYKSEKMAVREIKKRIKRKNEGRGRSAENDRMEKKGGENITKNRIDIRSTNGWVKIYTHGKRRRETKDWREIGKGIIIEN